MKKIAHFNESLVAGLAAGVTSFFVITEAVSSPIWLRIIIAVSVLVIVYIFGRRRHHSVSTDGEILTITEGSAVRHIPKSDIDFYQIMKRTDYQLRVVLKSRDAVLIPLHGVFSERSVLKVFESLGISCQPAPHND